LKKKVVKILKNLPEGKNLIWFYLKGRKDKKKHG